MEVMGSASIFMGTRIKAGYCLTCFQDMVTNTSVSIVQGQRLVSVSCCLFLMCLGDQ